MSNFDWQKRISFPKKEFRDNFANFYSLTLHCLTFDHSCWNVRGRNRPLWISAYKFPFVFLCYLLLFYTVRSCYRFVQFQLHFKMSCMISIRTFASQTEPFVGQNGEEWNELLCCCAHEVKRHSNGVLQIEFCTLARTNTHTRQMRYEWVELM